MENFRKKNKVFKEKQKSNFDSYHAVRPLPEIPVDSDIWISSGNQSGERGIVMTQENGRSYLVEGPTGTTRRNRCHLNVVPRQSDSNSPPVNTEPAEATIKDWNNG